MTAPAPLCGGSNVLGRLLLQSSHYSAGSFLIALASLVSFPVLTRAFSVADYGALNLVGSLLLLWAGLGKLGIQQSIARFHAETVAGRRGISESRYVRTVLIGMGATGLAATAGWMLMSLMIPGSWWQDSQVAALLLPLSGLVLVRVLDSAATNLLRAQQRSVLLNAYLVARKYLNLALVVVLIFTILPGLKGFFAASFVVETAFALALCFYLQRRHVSSDGNFSGEAFRDMLAFGAPLIALEIASLVLNLGDRYVLQSLVGAEAVGLYSAAYNFSDYVRIVLFASFAQALTPLYAHLYEQQGEEATAEFVARSLRIYIMVSVAVLAGMTAVGGRILTLLASDRYAISAAVIPLIAAAMCVDGGSPFFSAGMYLRKRNRLIVPFVVGAAILNIALNFALVPMLGMTGSAVATLISYIALTLASWHIGKRFLRVRFPLRDFAKFSVLALVMYAAVAHVSLDGHWLDVVAKVLVGIVVYVALVLVFDRPTRDLALGSLRAFSIPASARRAGMVRKC